MKPVYILEAFQEVRKQPTAFGCSGAPETGVKIGEASCRNGEWQNPLPWLGLFAGWD
jgi:hypothetical protein